MEKKSAPNAPRLRHPKSGRSDVSGPLKVPGQAAVSGARRGSSTPAPTMPMEGAFLYHKTIDNSSLSYRHDPGDRDALRSIVSGGLFVVLLFVLLFGPRLWVRHSGYRQAKLIERIEQLTVVRDQLKVQRGRLEDLRRVAALADQRGLRETEEGSYTWFAPRPIEVGAGQAVAQLFGTEE